ncbi:MAG: pyridoxamine 5'-phosphate oxidase family protein [Acidimicrobiales bacterium]|jgi:hypothetical protein
MGIIPASHRDLLEARVATFATVGTDGYPQLSEVWFLAEDDTNPALAQQRAAFILDVANTFRYLELRADALVEPDDDYRFADKVGAKYGSDLRAHDQPGQSRVVVTLHPHKVNAVNMGG